MKRSCRDLVLSAVIVSATLGLIGVSNTVSGQSPQTTYRPSYDFTIPAPSGSETTTKPFIPTEPNRPAGRTSFWQQPNSPPFTPSFTPTFAPPTLPQGWYALMVGIDNYPDPKMRVKSCVAGAKKMESLVSDNFGLAAGHKLLDDDATKDNIDKEFDRLVADVPAGQVVLIFLNGHGARRAGEWYFLPIDCEESRLEQTAISSTYLQNQVKALTNKGCMVYLIVDSCHAGQLRVQFEPLLRTLTTPWPNGPAVVLMLASVPAQSARCGDYDTTIFTHCVIAGLQGSADLNDDGRISFAELRRYLAVAVPSAIRHAPKAPGINWSDQDFVLESSLSLFDFATLGYKKPFGIMSSGNSGWKRLLVDMQELRSTKRLAPPLDTMTPPSASKQRLVGKWINDDKDFELDFTTAGYYRATIVSSASESQSTIGRYEYVEPYAPNRPRYIELAFDNGIDQVSIAEFDGTHLTIRYQLTNPDTFLWLNSQTKYVDFHLTRL